MSDVNFDSVDCFVQNNEIWNIPYFSTLSIQLLRTNAGEQYTLSFGLFFLSIHLTMCYKLYMEISLGIHKLYLKTGLGWAGNPTSE